MTLYIYVIVYLDQGRNPVPAHWAVLITTREGQRQGIKHHAIGSPFHGYEYEKQQHYNLETEDRRFTTVFLGNIDDVWAERLDEVAVSITVPGVSSTPLDPFAVRQAYRCNDYLSIN